MGFATNAIHVGQEPEPATGAIVAPIYQTSTYINEELGKTVTPYVLPPDSPNLRMLLVTVNAEQREQYLAPYARGETISAIGNSEISSRRSTLISPRQDA